MIFQDVNWIRSNINKFSPDLRKLALEWYRPYRHLPCYLQKFFKRIRQSVRKIPVIVQVEPSVELQSCISQTSKTSGCKVKKELPLIGSFTATVNAKTLEKLVQDQNIQKIWHDGTIKAVLDIASPAVKANAVWDRNITGKEIGVAVIDTGVYQHPDLSGRITGFKDFVGNKTTAYDDNGHGTHVAGAIASDGSRSDSLYRGTAPGCNVIGVKVLNSLGSGSLSTVIQGIQWCLDNKELYNIRVINLSLGSTALQSYEEDPVCQAVEKAWVNGIVVCAAAGNSGPEPRTISSPGIDPVVITVGAIDDKNSSNFDDYFVAEYSGRGPTIDNFAKPDIVCPGTNIISLRSPSSTIDKQYKDARVGENYMATPVCAGIAALMLEADNSLKPDEIKDMLKQNAKPLPGISENSQGAGLADAAKSIISVIKT